MKTLRVYRFVSLIIACGCGSAPAASAYDYCIEPEEPACISSRYAFESEIMAARCRRDVDRFSRDLETYIACLDELKRRYMQLGNQTLTRLNCRMRGQLQC